MDKRNTARSKTLIGGLTISEATEKVYAIANSCGYESRTDRDIERGIGQGWPKLNPEDFEWIVSVLIPRHGSAPVKIGSGIAEITFGKNSRFAFRTAKRPPCCMYAKRIDGSITDISWRECFSPSDNRKKVLNALRNSIRPQIKRFQDSIGQSWQCQMCGNVSSGGEIDIDHYPKSFAMLVDEWLLVTGRGFSDVAVYGDQDLQVGDDFVDKAVKLEWLNYHGESTVEGLRALCRQCHLTLRRS